VQKNVVYGDHNRMTQVLNGTTVAMNYTYTGSGEQVRKYLGSSNIYSVYDPAGRWLGDYGNAGNTAPTQQIIWFGDLPVGVLVGSGASQKLHYIEPDALGTPRVVVDPTRGASGTAVWTWELQGEAFGNTAPNQDPDGDATNFVFDMRFPGQRYDSASGLNYNYFRDYEAATGRYAQSDPIGLLADISTYGYVKGNPLRWTDRLGLEVDINLFDPGLFGFLFGDKLYERAQRVDNRAGEISIGGHGLPGEVHGPNGKPLKLEDLADMIRQTQKWKDGIRRVRLYVCDSGKGQLRHQLAKILGPDAMIYGASDLVWYSPAQTEPTIFGGKEHNGKLVIDPTKPGFWNWTTTNKGYGSCKDGCF
jgi:RHS repeat-associated protein